MVTVVVALSHIHPKQSNVWFCFCFFFFFLVSLVAFVLDCILSVSVFP